MILYQVPAMCLLLGLTKILTLNCHKIFKISALCIQLAFLLPSFDASQINKICVLYFPEQLDKDLTPLFPATSYVCLVSSSLEM